MTDRPRTAAGRDLLALERHLRSGLTGLRREYGRAATDEQIAQWLTGYLAPQYAHLAIFAALPAAPALDVERLARAIHRWQHGGHIDECLRPAEDHTTAHAIAATYDADKGAL